MEKKLCCGAVQTGWVLVVKWGRDCYGGQEGSESWGEVGGREEVTRSAGKVVEYTPDI
jgi:hypothetical protein